MAVGNLNAINTLNAMGRGYGCQLVTVIQNLPQLQELYPKEWETFLSAAGFQIFTRPRDYATSAHLSKMIGTVQIQTPSRSMNERGAHISMGTHQKPYMRPEEVREMDDNECLIWMDGVPGVIRAGRRPYWECPDLKGKHGLDPYHQKD
jgi:type IV secretory pathway TraG/TraD family ATPase VirD4